MSLSLCLSVSKDSLSLLCCRVAALASADRAARLALSLSLRFLNRTSFCSAVSEARFSLSRCLLWHSLSFLLSSDSVSRRDPLGVDIVLAI